MVDLYPLGQKNQPQLNVVNINVISVQNKSSENDPIKLFLLIHGALDTNTHTHTPMMWFRGHNITVDLLTESGLRLSHYT